jgi:septal ring factor EnvC (AmiA/AmiB activator)
VIALSSKLEDRQKEIESLQKTVKEYNQAVQAREDERKLLTYRNNQLQTQLNEAQAQANDQKKQLVEFEQEREDLLNNSTRSIDTEMVPPMGLPAPELEYLRNVLLEFLTGGRDRKNLVKVIVAVCRFSDEQARKVFSRAL